MLLRLAAALLAILMFSGSGAFGGVMFRCMMSGQVHATKCCCHHDDEAKANAGVATLERDTRCCQPESFSTQLPDAVTSSNPPVEFAAPSRIVIAPVVDAPASPPFRQRVATFRARAPPSRGGPPLFVRNCVYLI